MEKLPKALSVFIEKKGFHKVVHFKDDYWFTPIPNSMYKNGEVVIYAEDLKPLLYATIDKLEVYNPIKSEYENVIFKEGDWYSRHGIYEERNYLRGLEDYVKIDYDDYNNVYGFALTKYLKDKHKPEFSIKPDGCGDMKFFILGKPHKLDVLKYYKDNQKSYWEDDENDWRQLMFFEYQALYNFVSSLDRELKALPEFTSYHDLYDKVVAGDITKDEFVEVLLGKS